MEAEKEEMWKEKRKIEGGRGEGRSEFLLSFNKNFFFT